MSKRPSLTERDPSATESGDGDPFLSRWARRKRIARTGGDPDAALGESSPDGDELAKAATETADSASAGVEGQAPALTDEDMPRVDTIDENTDMSGFFSPKVTQAVKQAALRKFFHSPAFNVVDGLDDYADDFRSFEALGDIITSDMRSQMDREAERAREAAAEEARESGSDVTTNARAEEVAEAREADAEKAEDAPDDQLQAAGDGAAAQRLAAADAGVTRDPGAQPPGRGKLRPKGAGKDR